MVLSRVFRRLSLSVAVMRLRWCGGSARGCGAWPR
jgi:hypothetical protein